MSKYQPLQWHLTKLNCESVSMTFEEIENILGFKLPASSRKHRPWWSNNSSNSVMTQAWLDAGYRSEAVDLEGRKLTFRRVKNGTSPSVGGTGKTSGDRKSSRHPLLGCLKGMLKILPGTDLTVPAAPDWARMLPDDDRREHGDAA